MQTDAAARTMRFPLLVIAALLISLVPAAEAAPICASGQTACAGSAKTTTCTRDPAPYGEGWDGFTGVWGMSNGVEYGAGGWDRCTPGGWSVGAFVNMDTLPAEGCAIDLPAQLGGRPCGYETAQARFDWSPGESRDCFVYGGLYGYRSQYGSSGPCPQNSGYPVPNPGWGGI